MFTIIYYSLYKACQLAGDGSHDCGQVSTGEFHADPNGDNAFIFYTDGEGDR